MVREIYRKTLVILAHEAFMWLTMLMSTALVFMLTRSRQAMKKIEQEERYVLRTD